MNYQILDENTPESRKSPEKKLLTNENPIIDWSRCCHRRDGVVDLENRAPRCEQTMTWNEIQITFWITWVALVIIALTNDRSAERQFRKRNKKWKRH